LDRRLQLKNGFHNLVDFLGMDDDGNAYLLCGYFGGEWHNLKLEEEFIFIFSLDNQLIGRISLPLNYCWKTVRSEEFQLDAHGTVYQLLNLEDGVCVNKWSRR
jgi:hypothetical protein